ncbi:uncharacterized protein LOC120756002 isoform X2 [Hirundo rustica]|uniref:uncharacterized protein LOC120756002 isoform X2 n=1 Tax=Hirundo rustica TaxID=43150 RepID=UPI001A94DF5A|nr:uncharacterized protein LOC120756002 isoform X2 [Hirundo rustica]
MCSKRSERQPLSEGGVRCLRSQITPLASKALAPDFQTNAHLLKAEPRRNCEEGLRCGDLGRVTHAARRRVTWAGRVWRGAERVKGQAGATRGLAPHSFWTPGRDGHKGCFPWTSPSSRAVLKTSALHFGPRPQPTGSRFSGRAPGPGGGKGLAARIAHTDPGRVALVFLFSTLIQGPVPPLSRTSASPAVLPRCGFRPGGVGPAVPTQCH